MRPSQGITRREFLNYVWGAAFSLFLAELGIGVYLFSLPRFREGEFGSDFDLGGLSEISPSPDSAPTGFPDAKTWLVNVGPKQAAKGKGKQGLLAIYKVCTHLGCLYRYESTTERFECPCHGSKFHLDGTKILQQGPAPRSLDRFVVELRDKAGRVVASTPDDGTGEYSDDLSTPSVTPLEIPADVSELRVIVRTSRRIKGGPPQPDPA